MKKLIVLIAALLAALLIAGCASAAPAASSGPSASELLASAKNNAPLGTLVGQATATAGKDKDAAVKRAEQNAVLQLVRGMNYIVGEMIDEQAAAGRLTAGVASDFKTNVQTALTRTASDAVKVESGIGAGDVGYAVYYLTKDETQKVLTKATNAAKEVVAAGNFNFSNFDAKFSAAANREWK